ncbi:MAG: hypothetical protein U9N54_07575, partial [candidate division Zixibacteria bacterium]|nr:hypothetical protein [candidate division Zixibacteria bacterium]
MENILPKAPSPVHQKKVHKKSKFSAVAIIFVIILTIVLFIFGERLRADLNQWLNPAYDQYGSASSYNYEPSYDYYGDTAVVEKSYTRA